MRRLDGVPRIHLSEIDSTSLEAARRPPPAWLRADRQTAARGRRGRPWRSPAGAFAASLVDAPPGRPADHALRTFVASLALRDALEELGIGDLALKWPNDLLLGGRKLAGILLEAPRPGLLIVGIGVNLGVPPAPDSLEEDALEPAGLGGAVLPAALMNALAEAYATREHQLVTESFAATRTDWIAHAARLGERITVRTMTEVRTGVFEDIDEAGHLVLGASDGRRTIPAADVFFEAA